MLLGDDVSWGAPNAMVSTNHIPRLAISRYLRVRLVLLLNLAK